MKQSYTILTKKLLDRYLDVKTKSTRSNSDLSPDAQTPTLLQLQSQADPARTITDTNMARMRAQDERLYYLLKFMLATACRVSEALSVKAYDITSTGHVNIRSKKGGIDRIVHSGECWEYLKHKRSNQENPFDIYSRFYVYRNFKKYGIVAHLIGRKNQTVTHLPRHIVAKSIKSQGMDMEVSRKALGQKSIQSTKYYHE